MAGPQCVLMLSVSAKRSHLPLKVFVELLTETVDAGPVQLLVQGICGSVCRSKGSQYGRVGFLQLARLRGIEHMAEDSLHFLLDSPQA